MKVGIAINAIVYFYHTINLFRFRFHQGIMKLCFGLNKKMLYPATQVVKGAEKKKKTQHEKYFIIHNRLHNQNLNTFQSR